MAVEASTDRRLVYTASGAVTGPFAITFPFFEVTVYLDGVVVPNTDYTLTQDSPGADGDLWFNTAPTGSVVIVGSTLRKQAIDYIAADSVEPEQVEAGLDRLTMIVQELDEVAGRTLRVAEGLETNPDPIDLGTNENGLVVTRDDGGVQVFDGGDGFVYVEDGIASAVTRSTNNVVGTLTAESPDGAVTAVIVGDFMAAAINGLGTSIQNAVADRDLTAPPGSPAEGARYIVGASATGAWSGHDNDIAIYDGGAWRFDDPQEGWLVWVSDEDRLLAWAGSAWVIAMVPSGVSWEGAWQTATAYAINDAVAHNGSSYVCKSDHTSGGTTEPGVGASWATRWDLLAQAGTNGTNGTSFAWQGAWLTATAYALRDVVSRGGSSYVCKLDHTSGASTEPGVGASWATNWDLAAQKGADGLGVGDVVGPASAVNNTIALFDGTTGKLLKDSAATIDTDTTLAANSDTRVASQKAVKAYADALIAANDAMVFLGVIDCSANPNYPAANRGATYRVSVAGKIGGGSGPNVEAGDMLICLTDGTAAGNHATVGAQWSIIQVNLDGALLSTHIGSTVQAYDLLLTNIAALSMIADRMIYGTGTDTVALAALTAAGRAILDDADAAAQRTTLGLSGGFADLASATTTDLSSIAGIAVNVTGTTTITGFGSGTNLIKIVKFAGALTLTHNATTLILPSSINIATAAGDVGIFVSDGSGNWRCINYMQVSGAPRLITETLVIAVSDETTAITTGTAKVTFRMPWAMTVTSVRASLTTASSSGTPTIDINEGGTSILSTKLTIDANEKTSTTAATAAVISDSLLADDAEMTIDIDTAGTGAAGLKVYIRGYRA